MHCPCIVVMARGSDRVVNFVAHRAGGSYLGAWPCGSYGKGALFL